MRICLSGESMTVMTLTASGTCAAPKSVLYSGSIPANGVVYVESGTCPSAYTPFNVSYAITEPPSECGNVYLDGNYTGQLTIAAAERHRDHRQRLPRICSNEPREGEGVLGLVANNFVRIYHPEPPRRRNRTRPVDMQMQLGRTAPARSATSPSTRRSWRSAHSFIVDNYDCGAKLGTLTVNGAIAQKYRGAVGTCGGSGTGYLKSYNYDDRLRYIEPPSFIEPETIGLGDRPGDARMSRQQFSISW